MVLFNRLSIKGKLTAIMLLVSMVTLISGFTFMIILEIESFKSDMITSTLTLARVIGDSSVVALAFGDKSECQKTLTRLSTVPHIECAGVYNVDGSVFASYTRAGIQLENPSFEEFSCRVQGWLPGSLQPIIENKNTYGTIYLRASTQPIKEKTMRLIFTMVALMLGLIIAMFWLSGLVQGVISKPILRLAEITRHVSKKGIISIRAKETREDEIGILFSGFDDMLNQIEKRKKRNEIKQKSHARKRRTLSSPCGIFSGSNFCRAK